MFDDQYGISSSIRFLLEYLSINLSPKSDVTSSALSNISFVCDAERQNLTRDSIRGVAGNPAPTAATPCSRAVFTKALFQLNH